MKRLFAIVLLVSSYSVMAGDGNFICVEGNNKEWVCGDGIEPQVKKKPMVKKESSAPLPPSFLRQRGAERNPFAKTTTINSQQHVVSEAKKNLSIERKQQQKTIAKAPEGTQKESLDSSEEPVIVAVTHDDKAVIEMQPVVQEKVKTSIDTKSTIDKKKGYFVQLASVSDESALNNIIDQLSNSSNGWVKGWVNVKGSKWWVVGIGPYQRFADAKQILNNLPQKDRNNGAWIRKLSKIQLVDSE